VSSKSQEILKQWGDALLVDIKGAIPSATGKTAASIYVEYSKTGMVIKGGSQIQALIDGRKPTSSGASKGSPTLQASLLEWIKARNITPREPKMSQEQLSWAMSKAIHRDGYKGKGNIFQSVITDSRIEELTNSLLDSERVFIQSEVIKQFKK